MTPYNRPSYKFSVKLVDDKERNYIDYDLETKLYYSCQLYSDFFDMSDKKNIFKLMVNIFHICFTWHCLYKETTT